jgi:DNA-binding CsgD family transcriptional regulator
LWTYPPPPVSDFGDQKRGITPEFIKKYNLSHRQADVTQTLLLGKHDVEIAALLDIKLNTVKTHIKKVYLKTGARGRYALMALVWGNENKISGELIKEEN